MRKRRYTRYVQYEQLSQMSGVVVKRVTMSFTLSRLLTRCLILGFDGALFTSEWKEVLWTSFSMGAPARQRQPVE